MNGVTTNYALDQAAGLTQVLADGSHIYLYGIGRVAQYGETGPEFFLTDGLGSVRQLVDDTGTVTLAKSYQPYGKQLSYAGSGSSDYGFTGEVTDLTGLIYLRARYYHPQTSRFITKDTWQGDYYRPLSFNAWLYGYANPIRFVDPTGHSSEEDPFDLLYGLEFKGNWNSENEKVVRKAVWLVADRILNVLGSSFSSGLPPTASRAIAFISVYGIRNNDKMQFEWDPKCYNCRPKPCIDAGLWNNQDPEMCDCEKTGTCYCLPVGGYTNSSRWIEFASLWSSGYANYEERRINNVIHELGHAFSARLGQAPATLVHHSHPPIDGDPWRLEQKPKGFYKAEDGNQTWMQSTVESGSEAFADMFLGWVFNKWAPNKYGVARADFMNEHMGSWISQAIRLP